MLRRTLTSLVFCALALLACAARAEACSCAGPDSACAAFGMSHAVFVGTVTEITRRPRNEEEKARGWGRPVARFTVEQAFAGVSGAEVLVEGGSGADCGYEFVKGTRYLVYAGGTEAGWLAAGLCSRTARAEQAAGDIEFLRALVAQPGATVSGWAGRPTRELDKRGVHKVIPVEGVRVTVAGQDFSREAPIDAGGRYRLSGLPPGTYHVEVHLREGLTVGGRQPQKIVKAVERGCAAADFYILDDGRVSGRVIDADGNPLPLALLTLRPADGKPPYDDYNTRNMRADEAGRYKFSALQPGRYLLGVRLAQPPSHDDPATAFPRTFYPGVTQESEAEVIELKAGEELNLGDLRLPPRLAAAVVRGRVVWDDGTPLTDAVVYYRETTYEDPHVNRDVTADAQGQFEFKALVGAVFQIHARTLLPQGDPSGNGGTLVSSEPQTLNVASPFETVTLVVKRPK